LAAKRKSSFSITFYTQGNRANKQTGLADAAGRILKRNDVARQRAAVSTQRKAATIVSRAIRKVYAIPAQLLTGRVKGVATPDTIRIFASRRRFYLAEFNAQWNGRGSAGVTASILVGSSQLYKGAFMAPGRIRGQAGTLVYTRSQEKVIQAYGSHKGKFRQTPIANRGPSTFEMTVDPRISGTTNAALTDLADYFILEYRRNFRNQNGK